MDYPFEYVERFWKYPNFTQAEIDKLKQKDDKSTAKSKRGNCVDSEDDPGWEEEEEVDRKEKRILKELEELEKECEKLPMDDDTESSTDSSCLTGGFNSFLETTDSDDLDRIFKNVEENEDVAARRFKIMRQCICHSPECSSRSVSSEDSSSSISTSTGVDSDDDPTTEDEIPGLEKGKEESMSEEELEDLYDKIDEETSSGSEEDTEGPGEKETECSEDLETSSEETDSVSDAGFDVEQELEIMEEMLEAKLKEEEEKRNPKPKKGDWETDSDEDSDSEDDSEDDEKRKEDGSEGSGGSDGENSTSRMERSKEMEQRSREVKSKTDNMKNKRDNVEEKSKEPRTAKPKKNEKEEVSKIQKAVGEPSGEEISSMKLSDDSPSDSLRSSRSFRSSDTSLSPTSSSSPSDSFHSADSTTTSGSTSSVSSSTTPVLSPLSSSTSSSTLLPTVSISSDSLILSESGLDDEDSGGIRNFNWDSDDVYASTGTDEELEKVLDFLDNAMKIVDGVFTEKEVGAAEKVPAIELEKFKNFALPLPVSLKTTTEYEMLEEAEEPKDVETLHKNFWMVQRIDTGHMNSAKIVSRKNPLPEHRQLRKDLENERQLLHELLPELPDPTHIARIEDMGFNADIKFLIYEDFGTDLMTLFETNQEVLHKSSSLFLITYFTFNAIKELHNYDLVHTNIRPSAYSVQLSPFNVKIIDYSKVQRFKAAPWKTTENMKPDAFSPRVFHQKDMEFDEFVDFESWIYTMIFLCSKQGLPWMTDSENMLQMKEEFYDDTCDFDYGGCIEAVPIAAGSLADETMSYEEFMDRMMHVFAIDSMMFAETDRPILYHPEELEDEKKMVEDPFGALDENHWDPADESDSSDGIESAKEREMYGEIWKKMGLDQDGNEVMDEDEEEVKDLGDRGVRGKMLEIQGKEKMETTGRLDRKPERSMGPQSSEPEKSVPEKSVPEKSALQKSVPQKKEEPRSDKKDRGEQKTQTPSRSLIPFPFLLKEKPERSMEKSSQKSEPSRNVEEKSDEKKTVPTDKPAPISVKKEPAVVDMTVGELIAISLSKLEDSDESTFSTSSSSESSAGSFSSWTSSTDQSDNPKFAKWNEKKQILRVEKVEYAEMNKVEKEDFEYYERIVQEWIEENYSSSDDSGPDWSSDSDSDKSHDSEKDECSEKDKKEREEKKKEKEKKKKGAGKEAKSKVAAAGAKSKEPKSKVAKKK